MPINETDIKLVFFEIANVELPIWLPVIWGIVIGLVFSTIGAAGGLLASIGLISIMGITNANLIKPTAQILTLLTPLIAVPAYYKQRRLVPALAILLGGGGIIGALIGSTLSATYLADMKAFKPFFGIFVLAIAAQLAWVLFLKHKSGDDAAARAASLFEFMIEQGSHPETAGVRCIKRSPVRMVFEFGGESFHFNPLLPFLVGVFVAIIASALGVGGGFLIVPFMTQLLGLPMFIVAGTATLAIFVSSAASISNYLFMGIRLDIPLLLYLGSGVIAGSFLGPVMSRHIPEKWLRLFLGIILLFIGLRYLGVL